MLTILALMVLGHFVIDIVFQPDFVAKHKSPLASIPQIPWYYVLLSHAASHGLGVFAVTGSIVLAMIETTVHFAIDVVKCLGWTNIRVDQGLHVVCKIGYTIALATDALWKSS